MKVIYSNQKITEELEVQNFYKEIAERLSKENMDYTPVFVDASVSGMGIVKYKLTLRSGTQFITELANSLPDSFLDHSVKDRFLTCVNPTKNSYKFYKLSVLPGSANEVKAFWGRMGTNKGELFGERSCIYPLSMFWVKYYEKLGKGYVDRSHLYLNDLSSKPSVPKSIVQKKNGPSLDLFEKLRAFAKDAVETAKVQVPITQAIIDESKHLLDQMRKAETVDQFNHELLELISILQRPVRTGDGTGVKRLMAGSKEDYAKIIHRESDLIQAMEGVLTGKPVSSGDFSDYGIEVYLATEKQKASILRLLSDSLKPKVKNVYRVIPQKQQADFNAYLKKHKIKTVKQLWHGSRNCNWMSIIQNSLSLNPDAVITGKMFGNGIYFAPSSMKSWNYTSYRGTSWAHGNSDTAFMGLYAVAYGKPYDVDTWSSRADYKKETLDGGYDCLHAHAGASLRNDEIVFYDEAAMVLNYIVEFA